MPASTPLRSLSRAVGRQRRLVGAVLLATAVAVGLQTLAPTPPLTAPVVVAVHDLAGGAVLSESDLSIADLPPDVVPDGARASPSDLAGRLVAGPVRRGEPLTDVRLVGAALTTGYGPGLVAAPVRIADPGAVRLLRPGDSVDVLAAPVDDPHDAGAAEVVARAAPVLVVPAGEEASPVDGALVVLAVPASTAATLATAAVRARLTVTLRP